MQSQLCITSVMIKLQSTTVAVIYVRPKTATVSVNGQTVDASKTISIPVNECQVTVAKSNPWTYTIAIPETDFVMSVSIANSLSVTFGIDSKVSFKAAAIDLRSMIPYMASSVKFNKTAGFL